ncbi:MAG: TRAP transporter substrate-binding protein [Alphaproteobacteria bacterium]|nr:TRAP transporter substrate-binding protein [Alphaproteobacteria bacterium]
MKRTLLFAALALPLAAAAQTKWDMATAYADTEFQTRNVRLFAEDLKKLSGGKLDITVHSAGSLIKNPEIKRSLQTGLVPAAEFFMSNLGPENPLFEMDAIPFLAVTYAEARHLWNVTRAPITDLFSKQGIRLLYSVPWPSQAFYTKDPVKSIADLKGKKMRTYNAQTARLATLMGTIPTTVQAPEIPQAFSTGIIDTMFTSGQTGVSTRSWEYTKFYYDTGAWLPKNGVFANEGAFRKLPADVQKAMLDAAKTAEDRGWKMSEEQNVEAPKVLGKNGLRLDPMTPQFLGELRKIGDTMLTDWLEKAKDDGRKVIAEYRKHVPAAR